MVNIPKSKPGKKSNCQKCQPKHFDHFMSGSTFVRSFIQMSFSLLLYAKADTIKLLVVHHLNTYFRTGNIFYVARTWSKRE